MIKLLDILNELEIKDPNLIQIGFKEIDENGGYEFIWISEDIILKHLLPLFPNNEEDIKEMVESWNDHGSSEDDMFILKQDLIKAFKEHLKYSND